MRPVPDPRRRAGLAALLACALLAGSGGARAQESGEALPPPPALPLGLAPARSDPGMEAIGRGFDLWLADALHAAGLDTAPVAAGDLASAGALDRALIPRLLEERGRVEVRLGLYSPQTGEELAAGRGESSLEKVGDACRAALADLSEALGTEPGAAAPPSLSDLASATLALDRADRGRLFEGWLAVEGRSAPVAARAREAVLARAHALHDPPVERARVLTASGDPAGAWETVGTAARLEERKRSPDPSILLAAGEIQLSRGNSGTARRYLDAAVQHAPDSADVQVAFARALLAEGDRQGARDALREAARLAPGDPRPPAMLLDLEGGDRARLAALALQAGALAADRLDPEPAREQLARAAELDPSLAARAARRLGDLEQQLGRPTEAALAYRRAASAGDSGADLWVALGRAQNASGDTAGAEQSLRKALSLEPRHAPALVELGTVLVETERAEEALPLLRTAREIQPADTMTNIAMARALRLTGANEDAIEVLATGGDMDDVRVLRELSRSQEAAGDRAGARASLERAIELEPSDPDLRTRLAAAREASGEGPVAKGEGAGGAGSEEPNAPDPALRRVDFDAMVSSFAADPSEPPRTVAQLGVREPGDWKSWLRRFTRLREPRIADVEPALEGAIANRFALVAPADADLASVAPLVDQLYDFDQPDSRSADAIAGVNGILGTDGVFVTRLLSHPQDRAEVSCDPGTFALETRLLLGSETRGVRILTDIDCVAGGLAAYGSWNLEALAVYLLLALFAAYPVVRGWGTVVVRIELPEMTKGFFSIHITRKSGQVKRETIDKKTGREKIRAQGRLDFLRRFERHMAGRETVFRWIPARSAGYTVTVGGPLLDARGKDIIGHFLEEQRARVRRGDLTRLDFDFRPRECAVEIDLHEGGGPAVGGRVALAGDPSSLRYARDGKAYLYLGKGEHTILVGSKDAAAEFNVLIDKFDAAVPLKVDIGECDTIFRDCPAAVEPFLVGDLATAADALVAAGNEVAARRLRGELFERQGRAGDAAVELEAAGQLGQAAELRASGDDHSGSAALYERAGDHGRAAAAHRAAGEWEAAARCYEEIYDYGNALECWREVGDEERELDLLEKLGEYQDAAQLARGRGDAERAIRNLQQVDSRHPDYRHACRLIAEIVSERGDHDLAVAKFEEALGADAGESASLDALESYAGILERAGRHEQALAVYETIQRRDVARTDLTTRIREIRAQIDTTATRAVASSTAGQATAASGGGESRYELLDEIGRGGMGVVYRARDKRLGRIVALKRLPENMRDHPVAVDLFEREARAAAALNHPNIVTLFDAGEEDGAFFITMELLEGRALNEILVQHHHLSPRDASRLGIQIAAGLNYAHERRIVHRDIKTANLFFTRDQIVKIMDFGIAKSLEEVRRSTTVVGGTPYYMAPEQATGSGVDHRADLYALGVTLFQLVTGELPFRDGDVTYLHAHEPPPDPREIEFGVPAELASLILRLMAKLPEERPASAATVGEELRAVVAALR